MKSVLIVDDSALMRSIISDAINSDEKLHVSMTVSNGLEALNLLDSGYKFDALVLDLLMPKMTGIEFLAELERRHQKENVIVVSTIAGEGTRETIRCLELGAIDFVRKPESISDIKSDKFRDALLARLYIAAGCGEYRPGQAKPQKKPDFSYDKHGRVISDRYLKLMQMNSNIQKHAEEEKSQTGSSVNNASPVLPAFTGISRKRPDRLGRSKKLVALCCSTGGPKALKEVIPYLPANLDAPMLIVQHMPPGFTASLAERLNELSKITVQEASEGTYIEKGHVYIARGGLQMRLIQDDNDFYLSLSNERPQNGLKPCADIMYDSLKDTRFDEITCVVLTGMGSDGTIGIKQLKAVQKLYTIAQDEKTCIVYGMPKAIYQAGITDEVRPLNEIAQAITNHVGVY
jgi:two-component system chemotaxis response regulator CheB